MTTTAKQPDVGHEVLALRHVHFEDLGTLGAVLEARGARIRYIDVGREALDARAIAAARLLVVLGGPLGVYDEPRYPWIADELRVLEARLAADQPIIGICLGAQLIARALGARVYAGNVREIGWEPLRLSGAGQGSCIAPLGSDAPMFHWHGDTFDLPAGATLLASTRAYENQVYSWGQATLAFQCHPELQPAGIESWLIGHAGELAQQNVDVNVLRADTRRHGPALAAAARLAFGDWLGRQLPRTAAGQ